MWAERSGTPTDLSRYQTRVWTESSQSWKTPTYYGAGRMRAKHKHTDNHTALAQSCSFITSSLMECEIHSGWSSEDGIFDKEPTPPSSKSSKFQSLLHLLSWGDGDIRTNMIFVLRGKFSDTHCKRRIQWDRCDSHGAKKELTAAELYKRERLRHFYADCAISTQPRLRSLYLQSTK